MTIEKGDKVSWTGARRTRCTGYVREIDGDIYYITTHQAEKRATGGFKAPRYKKRLEDLTLVKKKVELDNGITYRETKRSPRL